jgi:PAS domain S-box-containing protein
MAAEPAPHLISRQIDPLESRQLCQLLLEHSRDMVTLLDVHGRRVYVSPSFEQFVGQLAIDAFSGVHPDDLDTTKAAFASVIAGQSQRISFRHHAADGSWHLLEGLGELVEYNGQPHVLEITRDVTGSQQTESALWESVERLRLAARASNVGLWDWDLRTNHVLFSREWKSQLGYDETEIGDDYMEWETRLHPDDLVRTKAALSAYQQGRHPEYSVEFRMRHRDGSWRWIYARGEVLRDSHGTPTRMLGCHVDITERKRAEEERRITMRRLEESEQRLRDAQRIARVGHWHHDFDRDVVTWSEETYRIWGLPFDHPLDIDRIAERIHPDDRAWVRASMLETIAGGPRHDIEFRIVRPDGEERILHNQGDLAFDASGRAVRFFGTVQDITELRHLERTIVESHNLLTAVIEGTDDVVFVKDVEGRYLMINSAGARNFRMEPKEILGKDDRELWRREIADWVIDQDRGVMTTGQPQTFEYTMPVNGEPRTLLVRKSVFRDRHGKIVGLIGISRDITDHNRLEEQLRQSQKMEAVGRLAGGVAHDFNNLLTVIHGCSELLFNEMPSGDPNREMLAEIQRSAERAANLTRQLLAFSRKQVLRPQVVSVTTVLTDLLKLVQRLIGEDIEVAFVQGASLALARVDPGQFEQAIINLAVNARDAMPHGGRLTIETRNSTLDARQAGEYPDVEPGSYVMVSITDSGHGMDDLTTSRIFEPFFTTKEPGKGTGLGLAMVYGFVKQSGGHIEVVSQIGHGTTFNLYLPQALPADSPSPPTPRIGRVARGTETVLLVEDEEAVRDLAKRVLESSGYTVIDAGDGVAALDIADRHTGPIDVVVTDLVMPRMGGRQLADALLVRRPNTRVIFMSGYSDEAVGRQGVSDSVEFLQKPFSPFVLVRKVRDVLDSRA